MSNIKVAGVPAVFFYGGEAIQDVKINEDIKSKELLVIAPDGVQIGILETKKALILGNELGLDLVEVSPDGKPPVARLMNYGKYKYEQSQKARVSRKNQTKINVKELKLKPKISPNDFYIKLDKAKKFIANGDKVKLTMWFRGREAEHPEYGQKILDKFSEELKDISYIDLTSNNDGKSITMVLLPLSKKNRK